MALTHAVLSVLAHQPYSGYDLAKVFDDSVGYFWQATHQQIYRELKKLEEQGWVTVEVIPQAGPLDKKVYNLTELGREKLREWLAQECEPGPLREDILVKLFAGYVSSPAMVIRQLEDHQNRHQRKLQVYLGIEQALFPQSENLTFKDWCQYLTLRRGIEEEKTWINWCQEAIATLQKASPNG